MEVGVGAGAGLRAAGTAGGAVTVRPPMVSSGAAGLAAGGAAGVPLPLPNLGSDGSDGSLGSLMAEMSVWTGTSARRVGREATGVLRPVTKTREEESGSPGAGTKADMVDAGGYAVAGVVGAVAGSVCPRGWADEDGRKRRAGGPGVKEAGADLKRSCNPTSTKALLSCHRTSLSSSRYSICTSVYRTLQVDLPTPTVLVQGSV